MKMEGWPTPEQVASLEERFPVGTRVRAVRFGPSELIDDNVSVPPGTEGTVTDVDGAGTVHVKWDNGRTIGAVVHGGVDRIEVVR